VSIIRAANLVIVAAAMFILVPGQPLDPVPARTPGTCLQRRRGYPLSSPRARRNDLEAGPSPLAQDYADLN
jgi:hypothetical protein